MALVAAGFRERQIEEWSWPKFRYRAALALEAELKRCLVQAAAVWDPKAIGEQAEALARGLGRVNVGEQEWERPTMERIKRKFET
jgi:hypothetical protein